MKWDFFVWQQASDLMEQADRIERNFLQIAASHYLASKSPAGAWAPSVNVVETDQACWVVTALPGAEANQIEIRLEGNELIIAAHGGCRSAALKASSKSGRFRWAVLSAA
jgi:HSP20 family molecular chaperone IbpA